MTVPLLDASIVALQPTQAAAELCAQLANEIAAGRCCDAASGGLSMRLSSLVHGPAHDGDSRAGVSMRGLPSCFIRGESAWARMTSGSGVAVQTAEAGDGGSGGVLATDSNHILSSASFDVARALVLEHGCATRPRDATSAAARPLNELLRPTDPFPIASACAADVPTRAIEPSCR